MRIVGFILIMIIFLSCQKNEVAQEKPQVVDTLQMEQRFIPLAEVQGKVISLTKNSNDVYVVPIDTTKFDDRGPTHFNILIECSRPPKEYAVGGYGSYVVRFKRGSYWWMYTTTGGGTGGIRTYYFIDTLDPYLNTYPNNKYYTKLGWGAADFSQGYSTINEYGNNGYPDSTKMWSKHVLGPIFPSLVLDKTIWTLYVKTSYYAAVDDGSGNTYTFIKTPIRNPQVLQIKFQLVHQKI